MGKYISETAEKRIPRLIEAILDGFPVGNLQAAIEELQCKIVEYREIEKILREKIEKINEESKKRILLLQDAIFVLESACDELQKSLITLSSNINEIKAQMLQEQVTILREEFKEINKALLELIKRQWWKWGE